MGILFVILMDSFPYRQNIVNILDETAPVFVVSVEGSAMRFPIDCIKDFIGPKICLA